MRRLNGHFDFVGDGELTVAASLPVQATTIGRPTDDTTQALTGRQALGHDFFEGSA